MALEHGLTPFWASLASAPTSSIAVSLALKSGNTAELSQPPISDSLPKRARLNLDAVLRTLEIGPYAEKPLRIVHPPPGTPSRTSGAILSLGTGGQPAPSSGSKSPGTSPQKKPATPDTAEVRAHVEALRRWASESSHAEPPEVSLRVICGNASCAGQLIPPRMSTTSIAAIVGAISKHGSDILASALCGGPLLNFFRALRVPAPRDVISAFEALSESHSRATLGLFHAPCNAHASEALCRIAGMLPAASAFGALRIICSEAKWGEPDVRLAEALIAKCRDENGLASLIVGGLEQHVSGLGNSLRFGKLLLAVVKDVPNVKENYGGVIRNVAGQSSVFLAKRAVSLLPADAMDVSEP